MIRAPRILLSLAAALPLLFTGCTKTNGAGGTSATALYLFDGAAKDIVVWKDLDATASATTTPAPDLTLANTALERTTAALAWGGMALDAQRNRLYLLYQDGFVIRIDALRSQSGTILSNDIVTFTLDTSSSPLTGSQFGQLALDPQSDTLYACENGTSSSRVWAVSRPDTITSGTKVPLATVSDDESGTGSLGVAAGQSAVYAYFTGGNPVTSGTSTYNGPRLRKGVSAAFTPGSVIIGSATGLDASAAGTLALDTANSRVYVGLDAGSTAGGTGGATVLAFQTGQFGLSPNQAPSFVLGDSTTGAIMALAHPGTKAWLVGLQGTKSSGIQSILVWKQPASGVKSQSLALGASTAQYLAAALDGTGS